MTKHLLTSVFKKRFAVVAVAAGILCGKPGDGLAAPSAAVQQDSQPAGQSPTKDSDEQDDNESEPLATINGGFALPDDVGFEMEWSEFRPRIVEKLELQALPLPENWAQMSPEERQTWFEEFYNSPQGKQFREARQKALAERRRFPIDIDAEGKYTVYDVPRGDYVLEGSLLKIAGPENAPKKYRLQAYGEFAIGDADVVELGEIVLIVDRIFEAGDEAPAIQLPAFSGESLSLSKLRGQYVLIDYWGSGFEPSQFMLPQLQEAHQQLSEKYKLQILSISLDEELEDAKDYVQAHSIPWLQGYAGQWDHPAVTALGVRGVPSFWLIDPQGKIALANDEFMQRYALAQSLSAVVDDFLSGENKFEPPEIESRAGSEMDRNR